MPPCIGTGWSGRARAPCRRVDRVARRAKFLRPSSEFPLSTDLFPSGSGLAPAASGQFRTGAGLSAPGSGQLPAGTGKVQFPADQTDEPSVEKDAASSHIVSRLVPPGVPGACRDAGRSEWVAMPHGHGLVRIAERRCLSYLSVPWLVTTPSVTSNHVLLVVLLVEEPAKMRKSAPPDSSRLV